MLKAYKRETLRKMRFPAIYSEGSRKTTGSIGRVCKASNALQLTGTNSQSLDRFDPLLANEAQRWRVLAIADSRHREPNANARMNRQGAHTEMQLIRYLFDIRAVWTALGHSPLDRQRSSMRLAGDHTQVATPVPIPNTAVKHLGPMVVRIARK